MILLYLLLLGLAGYMLYHLVVIVYHGVKSGLAQAESLEKQFGPDIIGAFKYQFGVTRANDRNVGDRPGDQG